ncbi:PREDICTED: protein orai-2-like [Amphimedon queenslandica]|uniref:Uncharacterized protein n=1 Tax=Amphimedon queenslandica TaxID=400682 RepID=A0AAN0IVG6_AMPQE|nr:PREDICTED: protein orai-2-like [Amphimedon queenslandica]|eukprot:XP_019848729.1 PREDICTED: protein orai-2-like [Amphimedon queenslandica]
MSKFPPHSNQLNCILPVVSLLQVGLVEIEVSPTTPVPLLIIFAMHSAVLVFIHLLSLMLATFLLPELEAAGTGDISSSLDIAKSFTVQLCWVLSNVIGIILLITEIILVAFVKFYPTETSEHESIHAATATILILFVLCVMAVPLIIYQSRVVAKHKLKFHERGLGRARQMLEDMNFQIGEGGESSSRDATSYKP